MKVVVDTMMWVSYCALKDGHRYQVMERARKQRVRFFVSDYLLREVRETLLKLDCSKRFVDLAERAILRMAKKVRVTGSTRRYVPGDPDDDPIVQTALLAKADYLVTADKEILQVEKVEDVRIMSLDEFEALLESA